MAFGGGLTIEPAPPQPIVGGQATETCEWPSVVAIREDDDTPTMCTGSLLAPTVVLTAAHCITDDRPIVGIGFGELSHGEGVPERIVEPIECVSHPQYWQQGWPDVGYCLLAEPVTDVPVVPLLSGCEVDELQPGTEVMIVGFGATYGWLDDNNDVDAEGVGTKRYTTQTIDSIDDEIDEVNMVGETGSQSACFGDSGGPALVQLQDGSWRVFGTGGHLYDPGGLPPPVPEDNLCGAGVAYGFASRHSDWIESQTGVDVTPCWDGETWDPGPECGDVPATPQDGTGSTWANGCSDGPVTPAALFCEAPGGTGTGTGTGTGDTGDDTTGGSSTGGLVTTTTGLPETSGGTAGTEGVDVPDDTGDSSGTTTTDANADDDGAGCGCSARGPSGAAWLGAVLVLVARRRRAASVQGQPIRSVSRTSSSSHAS